MSTSIQTFPMQIDERGRGCLYIARRKLFRRGGEKGKDLCSGYRGELWILRDEHT